MSHDQPPVMLVMIGLSAWCFWYWLRDLRSPPKDGRRFPGATQASGKLMIVAVFGSLYFLAVDLVGQHQLGTLDSGPEITMLTALFMLAWTFLEELTLRGYLVVEKRGAGVLMLSIIGFSLVIGLLASGSVYVKGVAFMTSMWYFALRFCRWNPQRSLLPCILAHLVTSIGLIVAKACQSKISGIW